jgi:hypothetical protein
MALSGMDCAQSEPRMSHANGLIKGHYDAAAIEPIEPFHHKPVSHLTCIVEFPSFYSLIRES